MPIHRGAQLDSLIARLPGIIPAQAKIITSYPNLANQVVFTMPADTSFTAWTELVSAANAPTKPFCIFAIGTRHRQANTVRVVAEIGIGASGAESAVSFCWVMNGTGPWYMNSLYPIPAGTRVAVRVRNESAGTGGDIGLYAFASLLPPAVGDKHRRLVEAEKYGLWYPGPPPTSVTGYTGYPATGANWAYGAVQQVYASTASPQTEVLIMGAMPAWDIATPSDMYQAAFTYGSGDTVFIELGAGGGNVGNAGRGSLYVKFPFPIRLPAAQKWGEKSASSSATPVANIYYQYLSWMPAVVRP